MALLVHTLLCLFDSEEGTYRQLFSVCWFPYSMVEMREFKSVAENIINELAAKGRIGSTDITKSVLETAAGVRMWQALRQLSDHALLEHMQRRPSILGQGIPKFWLNEQDTLTKSNVDPKALDRALRSLKLQIVSHESDFTSSCQQIAQHQQQWVKTAESLSTDFKDERAKNIKLVAQAKQMGLLDVHGMPV